MISEGSCDTEDCNDCTESNDAEIQLCITGINDIFNRSLYRKQDNLERDIKNNLKPYSVCTYTYIYKLYNTKI